MSLFLVRYHSAFDRRHTRPGQSPLVHETILAADGGWNVADVADAYSHNNPGIEIISCIADPSDVKAA